MDRYALHKMCLDNLVKATMKKLQWLNLPDIVISLQVIAAKHNSQKPRWQNETPGQSSKNLRSWADRMEDDDPDLPDYNQLVTFDSDDEDDARPSWRRSQRRQTP